MNGRKGGGRKEGTEGKQVKEGKGRNEGNKGRAGKGREGRDREITAHCQKRTLRDYCCERGCVRKGSGEKFNGLTNKVKPLLLLFIR